MNPFCDTCIYKLQFPLYGCAKGNIAFHEGFLTICEDKTVMTFLYSDKTTGEAITKISFGRGTE
jgi:hypothetical protein